MLKIPPNNSGFTTLKPHLNDINNVTLVTSHYLLEKVNLRKGHEVLDTFNWFLKKLF